MSASSPLAMKKLVQDFNLQFQDFLLFPMLNHSPYQSRTGMDWILPWMLQYLGVDVIYLFSSLKVWCYFGRDPNGGGEGEEENVILHMSGTHGVEGFFPFFHRYRVVDPQYCYRVCRIINPACYYSIFVWSEVIPQVWRGEEASHNCFRPCFESIWHEDVEKSKREQRRLKQKLHSTK